MRFIVRFIKLVPLAAAALVFSACAGAPTAPTTSGAQSVEPSQSSSAMEAADYQPVTMNNCGFEVTFNEAPKAAITLNQGATEVMLALGLEDKMVGTAYLDDKVADRWQQAYEKVPVLAEKYPTKEAFLSAKPDFSYASYSSAFTAEAVGTREELKSENIGSYLSPFGCPEGVDKAPGNMESAWAEAAEVARIFGVEDRATELRESQQKALDEIKAKAVAKDKKIFWYDSGDKEPFVGAGTGSPQIVIDTLGGINIFKDVEGNWATGSWEKVVAGEPDLIVVADASWSTAQSKIDYMKADPVLSQMKAVKEDAFLTVPFSETTAGLRLVDGAERLAGQLAQQ